MNTKIGELKFTLPSEKPTNDQLDKLNQLESYVTEDDFNELVDRLAKLEARVEELGTLVENYDSESY